MTKTVGISNNTPYCPYHSPILRLEVSIVSGHGQTPMERFLVEHPSEQPSFFLQDDTGKISTWKECLCRAIMEADKREVAEGGE
jgi:hypothetical protein